MKKILPILARWWQNDPFTGSAAIAYYAIFSIPGLLVITLALAAIFMEADLIEQQLFGDMRTIVGDDVTQSLHRIVDETRLGDRSIWAMLVGVGTLLIGASGLFIQMQRSLNHVWDLPAGSKKGPTPKFVKDRLISFGMVVVIGFLFLVTMTITAAINILNDWVMAQISTAFYVVLAACDFLISLGITAFLFALIFRVLPDVTVRWRHALQGGVVSAVLFHIGEYALNFYFELAEPASTFGAAGSIILLMLWVFYSAMILLLGAETARAMNQELAKAEFLP
jgi:membrane protein